MCAFIFDDFRLDQVDYLDKLTDPVKYGINMNDNCNINMKIRLLSSICSLFFYNPTREDLKNLLISLKFKHITPKDFEFITEMHPGIVLNLDDILYGRGIDITLKQIRNLLQLFVLPMTKESKNLNAMFDIIKQTKSFY